VRDRRPVVVTGAMRPPSAMGTDADNNLLDAVRVAAAEQSAGRGALVALNNEIQSARDVAKTDSYRVETFQSGHMGFLGYADADGAVAYYRYPERRHSADSEFDISGIAELPRVDIAYAYAGANGVVIDALVAAGASGIVAAGQIERIAAEIAERGPILYSDVAGHDRDILLSHVGDVEAEGWLAFAARPDGAARDCFFVWDAQRGLFVLGDESGARSDPDDAGSGCGSLTMDALGNLSTGGVIESYPVTVDDDDSIRVDINNPLPQAAADPEAPAQSQTPDDSG